MGERVAAGEFQERERAGTLRRGTRRTGRFEYRTVLPGEVNAEDVNATLRDGVLTVNVPKAEAPRPRYTEITAGDCPAPSAASRRPIVRPLTLVDSSFIT